MLGVVAGDATVTLGGSRGREFEIKSGDVLVLPAGTGHRKLAEHGLPVVGAYPDGMEWDLCRGDAAEHDDAVRRIRAVPLPMTDPVGGASGPLRSLWTS